MLEMSQIYCELCMYYTDKGVCSLSKTVPSDVGASGCESFIERPMVIGRTPGCCGLSGLPTNDTSDDDFDVNGK